jgi:inner membrane protein
VEAPSHVVFGLAGAVVADSLFHITGASLLGGSLTSDPRQFTDVVLLKAVFYGAVALGALTPDIDNARSTIGQRAGFVSKGIQKLAGHRTLFHSLLGLAMVGAIVWAAQYALGLVFYRLGYVPVAEKLGVGVAPGVVLASGVGVVFIAFLLGYFLHILADSLTYGGVPWLWPNHTRFGFPPNRNWRFHSGSRVEPFVVGGIVLVVVALIVFGKLTI